jgi:hypothetical protein
MAETPPIESSSNSASPVPHPDEKLALDRRDVAAMAALVGIVVFLFWRALFTSDMLYFRDIMNYSYPQARLIHEVCRQGRLPYWNPYLDWGVPLLANPNSLFFYPYTLVMILLPIHIAYPLHYAFHVSVAVVGAYLLARQWGQSRLAADFAASVFAFSGPVLSLGNFYNFIACAVWIPWALWFTEKAVQSRSLRPWLLLTGVFTLQFLAGEPLTLMATFGLSTFYALYRMGNLRRPWARENLRILGYFFVSGCLTMALAAVQSFPAVALLSNSRRGFGIAFDQSTFWSFHPLMLLEVLVPNFFGSAFGTPTPWKSVLNSWVTPFFLSFFVGVIPFLFALVGWAGGRDARRKFAAWAGLAMFVLALGRFTPVYHLLFTALPLLHLVRYPVKLLIPPMLFLGLLAGWGLDAVRDPSADFARHTRRLFISFAIALGFFGGVWAVSMLAPGWITSLAAWHLAYMSRKVRPITSAPLPPEIIAQAARYLPLRLQIYLPGLIGYSLAGIAGIAALGRGLVWARRAAPWIAALGIIFLVKVNYSANPTVPRSFYTYRPPALAYFQKSEQPYRFCYIDKDEKNPKPGLHRQDFLNFDSIPAAAGLSTEAQGLFRERILLHWGTMLTGYEATSNMDIDGSLPVTFRDFWGYMNHLQDSGRYDCLLGRTNVRYILMRHRDDSPVARELAPVFNGSPSPSYLYEDDCFLPRAYAVASARQVTNETQAFDLLSDSSYDALGQVILATPPAEGLGSASPGPAGKVEIARRETSSVTLTVNLSRPGYVVLLDRYDPNWHATLDGHEVPLLTANILFRAVFSPPGHHEIHYYYRQKGLRAGFALTLATLALVLLVFWHDPHVKPWSESRSHARPTHT